LAGTDDDRRPTTEVEDQPMTSRWGTLDRQLETLRDLDIFRSCTHDELERIATISTELRVDAGRVLCRQGEFNAEFFVIVDGEAEVDVDGTRVNTLGRGGFFGEHALLDHSARNATVTALTPMALLVFNRAEFDTLLIDAPHAASEMLREISHRVTPTAPPG
jgi:CRP-like cAMP-binding protein